MPQLLVDGAPAPSGFRTSDLQDPAAADPALVFETLRTYGRRPFRLDEHLDRLEAGADFFGISLNCSRPTLRDELASFAAAQADECVLRVFLTRAGHRVVSASPLDRARIGAPVRLVTGAPPAAPAWVKHMDRAGANGEANRAGVDEVLWSVNGCWTETNRSNLFVVRGGVLLTAPADGGILAGVTRGAVLEAAHRLGIPTREAPVPVGPADEIWVTSTLKEIAPVVSVDGEAVVTSSSVGARLHEEFRRGT